MSIKKSFLIFLLSFSSFASITEISPYFRTFGLSMYEIEIKKEMCSFIRENPYYVFCEFKMIDLPAEKNRISRFDFNTEEDFWETDPEIMEMDLESGKIRMSIHMGWDSPDSGLMTQEHFDSFIPVVIDYYQRNPILIDLTNRN